MELTTLFISNILEIWKHNQPSERKWASPLRTRQRLLPSQRLRYTVRAGDETLEERVMTLWSSAKAGLVRLCQISVLNVRKGLARVTEWRWNDEAYLLRPRCCRNEQFRESE